MPSHLVASRMARATSAATEKTAAAVPASRS